MEYITESKEARLTEERTEQIHLPPTIIEGKHCKTPSRLKLSVQQSTPRKHGEGKFSLRDGGMTPHSLCSFDLDATQQ